MKLFCFLTIAFFLVGISVFAQDLIILKNGNMIEAKVMEISPSEIRYKRSDNLDGPMIVILAASVLSIRYENGTHEIINADTAVEQESAETEKSKTLAAPKTTAMDPNKLTVGINANPSGLLLYGPSICIEFSKGNFNSEINLIYPFGLTSKSNIGFGFLATFNYFWHGWIGGFYLGGGIGYTWRKDYHSHTTHLTTPGYWKNANWDSHINTFGLNLGYKFVMSSGIYFRTGAYLGVGIDWAAIDTDTPRDSVFFYGKPDLAVGYSF